MSRDEEYMRVALELAHQAYQQGEIPVGAVMVYQDKIIASAYNEKEARSDATAHAEMLVMQKAAAYFNKWRLTGTTLYCTLEPCPMCAGAMVNTRISRLVYGTRDTKSGAAGSIIDLVRYPALNHQIEVEMGILEVECAELLSRFFNDLRRDGRVGRRRSTRNRVGG